jgi:hypothetical protein
MISKSPTTRVFMTAWFSKAARKALIYESELYQAARQATLGQIDDLGGGVFKKRLNRNQHRAIILTKWRDFWIYEYLFAKKDMENIDEAELKAFRLLVKSYANLSESQIAILLSQKAWLELCEEKEV